MDPLQLTQRVFKSKGGPTHPLLLEKIPNRPQHYGLWKIESLEKAIVAVEKGTSIRRAAEMHGIPRSTLHDHISGRVDRFQHAKPGPCPYLTEQEEEELANFLVRCAEMGYPHTRQQVIGIVQQIVSAKRRDVRVTLGWWERFRQRHPYLTLRSAVPLSYVRAMAQDQDSIDHYYSLLEETLTQNDLLDNPTQLFNCDETGMPLNPKPLKTVCKVGAKNPSYITSDSRSQVTVLACTSAAGYALPPFVVFDRKTLNQTLTKGEVPGTVYGLSANGWMDMELFKTWFIDHFLKYVPTSRPLLLLMDGHSSHFCPEMIRTAAAEGVLLFTLPPHTTHLCQPLDKGPFAPLKVEWRKTVHNFVSAHQGRVVTRYDFSELFASTWYNAMSMKNITAGFRVTGVFPFNKQAVVFPEEKSSIKVELKDTLPKDTGIKYIPLYSPCRSRLWSPASRPVKDSLYMVNHSTPNGKGRDDSFASLDLSFSPSHAGSYSFDNGPLERSVSETDLRQTKCFLPVKKTASLTKFLKTPLAPSKAPTKRPRQPGRVLTSRENMLFMEEKEKEKNEKAALKEARKVAREEKKLEKARLAEQKKLAREQKKLERIAQRGKGDVGKC